MRHLVLILSLLLVKSLASLKIRPRVLQPDLEAISNYYNNINGSLVALIEWPEKITFRVELTTSDSYLKVNGTFSTTSLACTGVTYNGLFYKNNVFYVKNEHSGDVSVISPDNLLHYSKQTTCQILLEDSYLSIKYFSRKEIKAMAQRKYGTWKTYYGEVLSSNPASFLMRNEHILEYTFHSSKWELSPPSVDGGLRVLVSDKLNVIRSVGLSLETSGLFVDPKTFKAKISDSINGSIFGVRMGSVGFLLEKRHDHVRLLSRDDVSGKNEDSDQHSVSLADFLAKVNNTDPILSAFNKAVDPKPQYGLFQVHGHVISKFIYEGSKECPVLVEPMNPESQFLLGMYSEPVVKVCVNNVRVWPFRGHAAPTNGDTNITIMRRPGSNKQDRKIAR